MVCPDLISIYAVRATTGPLTDETWLDALKEDPRTAAVISSITSEVGNSEYMAEKYDLRSGLLFFKDPLGRERLVPASKVTLVLSHFHDSAVATAGHPSTERMLDAMVELVYMRKMAKQVRLYVRSCDTYSRSKPSGTAGLQTTASRSLQGHSRTSPSTFSARCRRSWDTTTRTSPSCTTPS